MTDTPDRPPNCLWECDGCLKVVEDSPHSHSDWGGVIEIRGPHCEECDQPMDFIGEGWIEGDYLIEAEDL